MKTKAVRLGVGAVVHSFRGDDCRSLQVSLSKAGFRFVTDSVHIGVSETDEESVRISCEIGMIGLDLPIKQLGNILPTRRIPSRLMDGGRR